MKYKTYLSNKNLTNSTIRIYLRNYNNWTTYIGDKKPNKKLFVEYIKKYQKTHKPASVHLLYCSILSIFKFEKRWKLLNECKDIKLPKSEQTLKPIINIDEYKNVVNQYKPKGWYEKRDWLIYSFILLTGVRALELTRINKKDIIDNKLLIYGKGNKTRIIYINDYLKELLDEWKYNKIPISKNNKVLSTKQINLIVKNISKTYFNKIVSPHGLRRSYATNLLKSNVNLEIVRKTLGHSSIDTTSRYIQYTDEDILKVIKKVF